MLFEIRQGDSPMSIETVHTHIVIEYYDNGRLTITTSAPDSQGRVGEIYVREAPDDPRRDNESTEGDR